MEIFLPIGGGRKINILFYFFKPQAFYIENELFSIEKGGLAIFNSTNC
jgi:hypothetical protein